MLGALVALLAAPADAALLFARDSGVPPPVQEFAWRVIEMTLVDEGSVRLAALKSSFITCTP